MCAFQAEAHARAAVSPAFLKPRPLPAARLRVPHSGAPPLPSRSAWIVCRVPVAAVGRPKAWLEQTAPPQRKPPGPPREPNWVAPGASPPALPAATVTPASLQPVRSTAASALFPPAPCPAPGVVAVASTRGGRPNSIPNFAGLRESILTYACRRRRQQSS